MPAATPAPSPTLWAILLTVLSALAFLLFAGSASASVGSVIELNSTANTTVAPDEKLTYFLTFTNVGDEVTDGSPLELTVNLPTGLKAISTSSFGWECSVPGPQQVDCGYPHLLDPHGSEFLAERQSTLEVIVETEPSAQGILTASFVLSGGGAAPIAVADPTTIAPEPPRFGVDGFDQQVSDLSGAPYTGAARHPYNVSTQIDFNTADAPNPSNGSTWPLQPVRDAFAELPPGFVGDPSAVVRCSASEIVGLGNLGSTTFCPPASQVGATTVVIGDGKILFNPLPVFNMVPPTGVPARFGFNFAGTVIVLDAQLRSGGDYGLTVASRQISEALPISGTRITFWGVPADPGHDLERACPGTEAPGVFGRIATEPACAEIAENLGLPNPPYERPPLQAFLRNPTSCTKAGEGLTTTLHIDSWFNPGRVNSDGSPDLSDPAWKSASTTSHKAPYHPYPPDQWGPEVGIEGCADVPFEPSISVAPTTNQADSPTGLTVDLQVPQEALSDPNAIASSDLKDAIVKLPAGMSVNPAQANGLGGCTLAEIDLGGENTQPSCPDSSKIGTLELTTPLLDHPIEGAVYLAAQQDNPFKSLLALYIVADDLKQTGTVIKLAGEVKANPETGQLETIFTNQPQLPFESLHLELFSGAQAPLITPPHCGSYATTATMTPWSGNAAAELTSSFQVTQGPGGSPCPPKPAPFDPKLDAGTQSPIAGSFSPFVLRLTREDASQRLAGLSVTLPEGLIGKPAGIPYCPEAALASLSAALGTGAAQLSTPACPAASQVGTVTVGAGAGPSPFFVQTGRAYLAGPYKGAPLSLAIATPALAGPFDLGNVLVRTALQVNPESAQITAVSDPLPTILHGIPLDLRDVRVNLDRPGFTLNPTSCDPMAIETTVSGTEGGVANPSSRFQVGECARLGFKPKLSIKLKGGTKRSEFPALRATLKARAGDANIARAVVSLPHSEFLAQSHIRTICTRVQFAADKCPKGSIYGHASAITPLLDKPLSGPVYLRSSSNPLPDLVVALKGQIEVDLVGRIDSKGGGIRTTFASVPDAPVSKFVLTMKGGKKGLLENSRDLCRSRNRASVLMDAQNGKVADSRVVLEAKGCGGKKERGRR